MTDVPEALSAYLSDRSKKLFFDLGIFTDRRRLRQCMDHLVSNAVKFSEQGEITISASVNGELMIISVEDQGIGINENDLPRLFKAFERFESHLKIVEGGSGLGLYLTHKIVTQLLGGSISVESRLGEGSRFELQLPLRLLI